MIYYSGPIPAASQAITVLTTNFTLFLSVTFVVSASPGPMMLSCMSNGGRYGIQKAFMGMIGGSLGNLVLMGLSALGLGLLVSQNPALYNGVKWVGAAYLIWLGIQIIRSPRHKIATENAAERGGRYGLLTSGFFIAISNPKGLIYFGALFPQFINYQQPLPIQFFILTCVFLLTDLIWMFIYAAAGNKIMQWLKAPLHQTWFNICSGAVLMGVGLILAFSEISQ